MYSYFGDVLRHMANDPIETFKNTILYSREKVKLPTNQGRQLHKNNTTTDRTESNLTK